MKANTREKPAAACAMRCAHIDCRVCGAAVESVVFIFFQLEQADAAKSATIESRTADSVLVIGDILSVCVLSRWL